MIKYLLIVYTLLVCLNSHANDNCGNPHRFWGDVQYRVPYQNCARCRLVAGREFDNCVSRRSGELDQESNVLIGSETRRHPIVFLKSKLRNISAFDRSTIYEISYATCRANNLTGLSHNACDNASLDMRIENSTIDLTRVVENPEDCISDPYQKLQRFESLDWNNSVRRFLDNRVCVVRMNRRQVRENGFINFGGNSHSALCAFIVRDVSNNLIRNTRRWLKIGCAPEYQNTGPLPFTRGLVSSLSFSVSDVLNADNRFERPMGIVNRVVGSKTTREVELPINLQSGESISKENRSFTASMIESEPDKVLVKLSDVELGKGPRPALEENRNSQISFFPCYATYTNFNNSKFQGIHLFSINARKGDEIGTGINGIKLYLGNDYIPTTNPKELGSLSRTRCDLCINAVKSLRDDTQEYKDSSIYHNDYLWGQNTIGACNLKDGIKISKISSNHKYVQNFCNNRRVAAAPLRTNMIDLEEQEAKTQCYSITERQGLSLDYTYTSESSNLGNYFVNVRPVITQFDQSGEARFISALSEDSADSTCKKYTENDQGEIFISPAGKRDRMHCPKTVCSDTANNVREAVCSGLYQGPESTFEQPDKICLMSSDKWDFISGRYKDGSRSGQRVPKMACTFLPGCKSLGEGVVPNIGNAIWNSEEGHSFGQRDIEGKCQEFDYQSQNSQAIHTYQYEIPSYDFTKEIKLDEEFINNKEKLQSELDNLKQTPNIHYISEDNLKGLELLKLYTKNNEPIFICKRKKPKATCIGGIYGDVQDDTKCVPVEKHGVPIRCNYEE